MVVGAVVADKEVLEAAADVAEEEFGSGVDINEGVVVSRLMEEKSVV